jgi:hypothetical protein
MQKMQITAPWPSQAGRPQKKQKSHSPRGNHVSIGSTKVFSALRPSQPKGSSLNRRSASLRLRAQTRLIARIA